MIQSRIIKKYIPMTETAYYILLALRVERHGYGIIKHVEELTKKRILLGPGTIYGTLAKMEKDGLIEIKSDWDRRKTYGIKETGNLILSMEIERLEELLRNEKEGM